MLSIKTSPLKKSFYKRSPTKRLHVKRSRIKKSSIKKNLSKYDTSSHIANIILTQQPSFSDNDNNLSNQMENISSLQIDSQSIENTSIDIDKVNINGNSPTESEKQLLKFAFGNPTFNNKNNSSNLYKTDNKKFYIITTLSVIFFILLSIPVVDNFMSKFISDLSYRLVIKAIILFSSIICIYKLII